MDLFEPEGLGRFDFSIFALRLNLDHALTAPVDPDLASLLFLSFHFPLSDDHRAYLSKVDNEEELPKLISLFSLYSHEEKHFFDLLLSPYGSVLMRQYTRLALLARSILVDIMLRQDVVAFPISDWVNDYEFYKAATPPVSKPSNNIIEIQDVIDTMQEKLRVFNVGMIDLPGHFSYLDATAILEGLAIIAQEETIARDFGEEYIAVFRRQFKKESTIKRYYGAQDFVSHFFEVPPSADIIQLVLFASLCGNFQDQDPNRVRYPKDVLLSMLLWLKDKNPIFFRGASPADAFEMVDDFFDQQLGNDLQGMTIQAAKANEATRCAFEEIATKYANHSDLNGAYASEIVRMFTNFRDVQAASAANVMVSPFWYFSAEYFDGKESLPKPIIYIESGHGLPVDDAFDQLFYSQSETRIDMSSMTLEERQRRGISFDGNVARLSHRMAPTFSVRESAGQKGRRLESFLFDMPSLDRRLWHKQYDENFAFLRALVSGYSALALEADRRELDFIFSISGTRVYSNGNLRSEFDLPEDWSSPAADPSLSRMFGDEKFARLMSELRARRRS